MTQSLYLNIFFQFKERRVYRAPIIEAMFRLQAIIKHYSHSHFQFQPLKWSDNYVAKCVFSLCDCLTLQDNHFERYKKKTKRKLLSSITCLREVGQTLNI